MWLVPLKKKLSGQFHWIVIYILNQVLRIKKLVSISRQLVYANLFLFHLISLVNCRKSNTDQEFSVRTWSPG
jgi:hypothetical protein